MARKIAMLIGISAFQEETFPDVPYAAEDLQLLANTLGGTDFESNNLYSFINEAATKTRIESNFRKIIKLLDAGDEFFLFYFGRGIQIEGENYLATADSLTDDLEMTSLSCLDLWNGLSTRGVAQRWFLDVSPHVENKINEQSAFPDIQFGLNQKVLQNYFTPTSNAICILSAQGDQFSYHSSRLKSRIFAHHLREAFQGKNLPSHEENQLTLSNLKSYLEIEIPRTLRKVLSEHSHQQPAFLGSIHSNIVLARFPISMKDSDHREMIDSVQMRKITFRSESSEKIKSLSGYQKGHHIPEYSQQAVQKLVAKWGAETIQQDIEKVFNQLRHIFRFKRKDLEASFDNEGMGFIRTPLFDYTIQILVDPQDNQKILWRREVSSMQSFEIVIQPEFDAVFGSIFDTFIYEFAASFSLETFVDDFEEAPIPGMVLHTTIDLASCDIQLDGMLGRIQLKSNQLEIQSRSTFARILIEQFLHFERYVRTNQSFLGLANPTTG